MQNFITLIQLNVKLYKDIAGYFTFYATLFINITFLYPTNPITREHNYYVITYFQKNLREETSPCIYSEFVILFCQFTSLRFVPLDTHYHMVPFPYSNKALLPPTNFMLFLSNILHFYMLSAQKIKLGTHCFLKSLLYQF